MTALQDLCLSLEHYLDATRNWERHRRYEASLARRVEGFTEQLGDNDNNIVNNNNNNNEPSIRILQFQPAWQEQLLLRIAKLPHHIINSAYAVTEATGPLPVLQDDNAMMGRDAVLEYLQQYRNVQLMMSHPKDTELYLSLIQDRLEPCRVVLQCHEDRLLKQRCLQAGGIASHWQARSFWRYLKYRYFDYRNMTTAEAVKRVQTGYQILEDKLGQSSSSFLLSTDQPTHLDAALWDHLMHALTDVHLVVVLAEFPKLLAFVQHIWDQYFAEPREEWQIWNATQNAANPFAQVPSLVSCNKQTEKPLVFRHAVELMEQLFVQDRNLLQSVAQEARACFPQEPPEAFSTWHRWRRGGSYHSEDNNNNNKRAQGTEEKVRREYHRNDEMWMAAMALSTVMALCVFGGLGSRAG